MLSVILARLLPSLFPEYSENQILNFLPGENFILSFFIVVFIIDRSRLFFSCAACESYRTTLSSLYILMQLAQVRTFFFPSFLLEPCGDSRETASSAAARAAVEDQPEESER